MKTILAGTVLSLFALVVGPVAAAKEASLVPPAQSTLESRQSDIQACISQANADVSAGKPLEDDTMVLLQGHATEAFIREGKPSVNRDFVPTPSASLFAGRSGLYGPAALSDRYVACLLRRGYKWPEKSGSPVGTPLPRNDDSARKTINPEMTKIVLGHYTQGIAFTSGAIWVAYNGEKKNADSGVFRVDPITNQMVTALRTGRVAGSAAAGEGAVWIGNLEDGSVTRIDPETNRVVTNIAVGKYPYGLDVREGSVWVSNAGSNTVSRIDSKTNAVIRTIAVGKQPAGIAGGSDSIWVANSKSKSVSRIDPNTNAVVATIEVHGEPSTVTAHGSDVWVSSQSRSGFSVLRIDAKTNSVVAETTFGAKGKVGGTVFLDGVLWAADRANGTLSQIDLKTNTIVGAPLLVGWDATILGVGTDGNGAIWLSNSTTGMVRKVKP
jgi:YVTN family beta-propeller protein